MLPSFRRLTGNCSAYGDRVAFWTLDEIPRLLLESSSPPPALCKALPWSWCMMVPPFPPRSCAEDYSIQAASATCTKWRHLASSYLAHHAWRCRCNIAVSGSGGRWPVRGGLVSLHCNPPGRKLFFTSILGNSFSMVSMVCCTAEIPTWFAFSSSNIKNQASYFLNYKKNVQISS